MADSLKGLLETATIHIGNGNLAEAERILNGLVDDPGRHVLGPETALGLPRRLHSAMLKLAKRKGDQGAVSALQYHLIPPVELLEPLFAVDRAERAARVRAAQSVVPTILHQIWIGGAPPETTAMWKAHAEHHGWTYRLWSETELAQIGVEADPVFRQMLEKGDVPGAVDVARYHVLAAHGGLYLDCDWVPVRDAPFEEAFPGMGISAIAETTPRLTGVGSPFLNNSVIAAPPGHPVFAQLLAALPAVLEALPKGPAWWVTGPLVFTLACRQGPVTVLDAGLVDGETRGSRMDVEAAVDDLRGRSDVAYLHAWKPWA